MEVSRIIEISSINEIKILSNVRLIHRRDLNPAYSKNNLQVSFSITGDLFGNITCYLCLDNQELSASDKNFIYPLFVESMNILVGKQISTDPQLKAFNLKIAAPKMSMNSKEVNSAYKSGIQSYDLELDGLRFTILTEYVIGALN
jgi:hypothetical protein